MDLLGERSQNNSYIKHVLGLYLYATGAQRQVLSVLSHLGLCSSYPTLVGTHTSHLRTEKTNVPDSNSSEDEENDPDYEPGEEESSGSEPESELSSTGEGLWLDSEDNMLGSNLNSRTTEKTLTAECKEETNEHGSLPIVCEAPTLPLLKRGAGLLARLSVACRETVRITAKHNMLAYVYDNINMVFKAAEQILGRKDSQENGTCATAFALFSASPADMRTADLIHAHFTAPPLSINDIVLSQDESFALQNRLQHTALRLIVRFGGQPFAKFRDAVEASTPVTSQKIPLHKTEIYPLPAMDIDESKTTGNAEVMETIFHEVGLDMQTSSFADTVKLIFGDQLSIARLRSLMDNRVGHDAFHQSYLFAAFGPGFFHHQMTATHAILETHWGSPGAGARNPGSLTFHNIVLDRKPIVLSSLPPYRTCRDLIFVSLCARLLHCLELVCGYEDIDEYAAQVTYNTLWEDVGKVMSQFANPAVVAELREARDDALLMVNPEEPAPDGPQSVATGDMVFENAVLFMRDALVLREFTDAIKTGDSGRIITILKILALIYRGTKHTKYAHELLFLIHNLAHVWPKPLR